MAVSIEQHVYWVVDRLSAMREAGFTAIEPSQAARAAQDQPDGRCEQHEPADQHEQREDPDRAVEQRIKIADPLTA